MSSHFLSVKAKPMMHGIVKKDYMMKAHSQFPSLFNTDAKEKPRKTPRGTHTVYSVIQNDFSRSDPYASAQTGG